MFEVMFVHSRSHTGTPPCNDSHDCDGDYDIDDIYAGMDSFGIETGSGCEADNNGDGIADVTDLLIVINGWGICP